MKYLLFSLLFFIPSYLMAGFTICHNGNGSIVNQSSPTAICIYYSDQTTGIVEHDRVWRLFQSVPQKYIKWTNSPQEMNQQEKDAVDVLLLAEALLSIRISAKDIYNGNTIDGESHRCFAKIVMDEFNILRSWLEQFKVEMNAASSLANLKTRVASLPNTPPRNLSQLKTAIHSCIDNGDTDE